jgi:uncharacterized membrane protein YfcA
MAIFAALPMTPVDWAMASALILVGSTLQAATGVGLGLIAGPILVLTLGGSAAIFIAIMLNLALSLLLLPQESGEVLRPQLLTLTLGAIVGIPLGWLILQQLAPLTLKTVAGVIVLLAALQLLSTRFRGNGDQNSAGPASGRLTLLLGGLVSGVMCGCLAIPGPAALWAMLRCGLPPLGVRATLRALFAISYAAAAAIHFGLDGIASQPWLETMVLLPAVLLGLGLALLIRRWIDAGTLGMVLNLVLLAIGISMLWRSWLEIQANV